jgi:hypothetical protein
VDGFRLLLNARYGFPKPLFPLLRFLFPLKSDERFERLHRFHRQIRRARNLLDDL